MDTNRLKELASALRFYLSPANLCHDKVLARYLTQQKRVPLDTFLNFNRVVEICKEMPTVDMLKEAAQLVDGVIVDKEAIMLQCEICTQDIDEWKAQAELSTVYVDPLPDMCDRDQIRRIFAQFGEVLYISLPKFSETHIVKGFAFIQFRSPLAAKASLCLTSTDPFATGRPLKMLSKSAWKAYKPIFASLQLRIQSLLQSNHSSP